MMRPKIRCRVTIQHTRNAAKVASDALCRPVYLKSLASCGGRLGASERETKAKRVSSTHRQEDVDQVHRAQDRVADPGPVEDVAEHHQDGRDDVVSEHLVVVLARRLEVDDDDLVQVDCAAERRQHSLSARLWSAEGASHRPSTRGLRRARKRVRS